MILGNFGKGMGKWYNKEIKVNKVCIIKEIIILDDWDLEFLENCAR